MAFGNNGPKLNAAFEEMRKNGILAKQNFSCCGGCATYALAEMIKERTAKGKKFIGAAYYHHQDTARANENGDLYLGFGAHDDSTKTTAEVGELVVAALRNQGFEVIWDGLAHSRIIVKLGSW